MKKPCMIRAFSKTLTLARSSPSHRHFSSSHASISIKRVTKSNFESALEDLRRHVRAADFVSVDLEMTGITSAPWRESLELDRSDVRYLKVKDSAEKFAVVQFGVCPFRWDGSKESFVAHPHNFYIFPRKELPVDGPSNEFLCQTTSIDFLAKYQFDFNACIHEGISYLSRVQEAEALHTLGSAYGDELINSQYQSEDVREIPIVSTFDVLFTERMKNTFRQWRDGLSRTSNEGYQFEDNSNGPMPRLLTFFFKMRPALKLNGFTSHQLRLIQLVVKKHFKDLVYVRVDGESLSKLVVYTDSDEDKALLMKEVKEDLSKEMKGKVKAAVGFRHVIDLLASEQKLVVGHNCFLDIAHIYSKFLGPLPPSIEEFAASIHKNLPFVVDTKNLLKDNIVQHLMKNNSTSLSSAFALLCPQIAYTSKRSDVLSRSCMKVEVQVDETSPSNWNSGAKHEAGYDAFMTGCVFAQMCNHLGIDFKLHAPSMQLAQHEKLQKHMNLLYLGWNSGTLIDLSTGTEILETGFRNQKRRYPKVVFENIVLIWGFSSNFKLRELKECICKVFGANSVTAIYYLDKTAVFIQFCKSEFVSDFLNLKESLERRNDPISVLHPLAKLLEGGTTRAAIYDTYKQICSSSMSKVSFADQAEAVGIKLRTTEMDSRELESAKLNVRRENRLENPNSDSVVKCTPGSKANAGKDENRLLFCEDILDSLYVNQSLSRKRTRTK
ncbi:hypothetical protein MRB53_011367 [Persea americana]|uniref:Uncharacterized protein n=1 Tax=Persea americana TaxID=3435 RepID=A0ACC2LUR3_PERAE|nr:hypothetical protein MRB53_011367 [Persea americana]